MKNDADTNVIYHALCQVSPTARYLPSHPNKFSEYELRFQKILDFLLETKRDKPQNIFTMAVDYFRELYIHHRTILKVRGVPKHHLDSKLAKRLYLDFIRKKGETYWAYGEGKTGEGKKWLHSKAEHAPQFIPEKETPSLNPTLTPDELLSRIHKLPTPEEFTEHQRQRSLQRERINAIKDRVCQR